MRYLAIKSKLAVHPEKFWSEQSIATVNFELGPWIQMSAPAAWRNLKLKDWGANDRLFKSWVLLLGVLPLDRHAFGTLDLSQNMRFVELSSSWVNRIWQHERVAKAMPGGCEITDKVSFAPRLLLLSPFLKAIYILVFRHRHSKLRALYAAAGGSQETPPK